MNNVELNRLNELFKLDEFGLKERLFEGLVNMYGVDIPTSPWAVIAALCDNYLDRSGYLLGEIRKESLRKKEK